MSDESIEVAPSAEQGNIPIDAPSEPPIETTPPVEVKEEAKPAEPQLFELPDGRKVDAETLTKEWKDNFAPEFTRRSQELAELKKSQENKPNEITEDPYSKPDYIPKSYAEVIEEAKQRAISEIKAEQEAQIEHQQAAESEVENQLSDLKKADPNLNENALFLHANEYRLKYGVSFPDLKAAYAHMKDLATMTKTVQQTTAKNIQKHADPVSTTQQRASGALPNPSHFSSAIEYLRSLNK